MSADNDWVMPEFELLDPEPGTARAAPVPGMVPAPRWQPVPGPRLVPASVPGSVPAPVPVPAPAPVPGSGPGPGTGSDVVPYQVPGMPAVPDFADLGPAEIALETVRHWVGQGRKTVRDMKASDSNPLGGAVKGRPGSIEDLFKYAESEEWVPPASNGKYLAAAGKADCYTIGLALKIIGGAISGAGDRPMRHWLPIIAIAIAIIFIKFH